MEVSNFLVLAEKPKKFCKGCQKPVIYEQIGADGIIEACAKEHCRFCNLPDEWQPAYLLEKDDYIPNYGEVKAGQWLHHATWGGNIVCAASSFRALKGTFGTLEFPTPETNCAEHMGGYVCFECVPR